MTGAFDTPQRKSAMAPVAPADARLFVLGSLPGEMSLARQRYYAHPANQFWRLVGHAVGEDLHALDYAHRLERLGALKIGLWDVIGSARRTGSLDQSIREAKANPIGELAAAYPSLRAIAFNGARAAAIGSRMLHGTDRLQILALPSSSPANTMAFALKAQAWAALRPYCGAANLPSAASSSKVRG